MPVPLFYPADDGRNICRAQMGRQTGTPGDTLFKFVFCVSAGATKVDQLSCRKCPRTLRRKRSFAVKRIINVDSLAMMMDTDRYATAQVTNNQIQIFIPDMLCGRISAGNGALVQRMPDSDAGHQRRPCDTGYLIQLIHNARIGYERTTTGKQCGKFGSYEASQVAGVGAHGMQNIIQHGIIHLIYAARYRFQQSAASHYGVKLKRNIISLQLFQHQVLAELKLVDDV